MHTVCKLGPWCYWWKKTSIEMQIWILLAIFELLYTIKFTFTLVLFLELSPDSTFSIGNMVICEHWGNSSWNGDVFLLWYLVDFFQLLIGHHWNVYQLVLMYKDWHKMFYTKKKENNFGIFLFFHWMFVLCQIFNFPKLFPYLKNQNILCWSW